MLHSLGYSPIQYGITVWGTAAKSLLHRIEVGQNSILITISEQIVGYCRVTKVYTNFEF